MEVLQTIALRLLALLLVLPFMAAGLIMMYNLFWERWPWRSLIELILRLV